MAGSCSVKDYFNCAVLIILDDLARTALFLCHVSKLTLLCYRMLSLIVKNFQFSPKVIHHGY